jgi:hypothetical protein
MRKLNILQIVFITVTILVLLFQSIIAFSQQKIDIWELMERRDLRLKDIDAIAERYFKEVGKVRGTGYKQYERWKYEMQFHLDKDGYIKAPDQDQKEYDAAAPLMATLNAPSGAWTEMGPFAWSRTTSWNPGVGRVTSISVCPANTNIIYVTSPGGGVWKSTQGGNQWVPLSDQSSSMMNMFSVAVHPTNPDLVFAGSSGGIIYKSTDGGATWLAKSSGMGSVRKIIFDVTNTQIMYAVGSGIFKSTDGGNTWVKKSTSSAEDIEFRPGNSNVLYASGSNVFRSLNAGETWTQLTTSNGITNSGRTLISVSPADSLVVYAIQANGSEFGRIYRSSDGGETFVTKITGSSTTCTNFFGYSTNGCGTGGQASYDMAMTVNPLNANEVHIAGIICWKSTDGGTTFVAETAWSLPNSIGYNHADVHVLEWVGSTIYSGSDGGIYKSINNGGDWSDLSIGLGVRQFYRIATSKTNGKIVTGGAQDNGSSILKSNGWIDWLGADGMDCLISPLDSNLIWGTSQNGSLYRTTNGGSTYTGIANPGNGSWVTPLAIESNSNVIYGGYIGVYKSTDLGNTWVKISDSVITTNLNAVAVAPSNPKYIYASNGAGFFVTKDGGTTWSSYTLSGISVTSIAIHPTDPEKVWISSSNSTNRVLVSINAGATFVNMSGNLPAIAARSIVVDETPDEGLYAGMNIGVYYTNKNMTGWINLTDNLPQVAVNEIELHKTSGKLRLGTYGRGLWERSIYSTCGTPGTLQSSNISSSSAVLSWTAGSGATSYNVEYKIETATSWTTAATNLTNNTYTLSSLTQGTVYDWRVNAVCGSGTSEYVAAKLTTLTPCPTPINLNTANITTQSANLNWPAVTGAISYTIEHKLNSSSVWINTASGWTDTSLNLISLTEGSLYDWRISATCAAGTGNSAAAQFTTAITCKAPTNLQTSSITSTSTTLTWNAITGATNYDIEFKLTSSSTWTVKATNYTSTTYNLTGLTSGQNYDWRVRSNCGTLSGYSPYASGSFSTPVPPCTDAYETNNTISTAKTINLNTPISASIAMSTDIDWFKITSPNSTSTNIRIILSNVPADYNVYLYNKSNVLIGSSTRSGTSPDTIIYNSTAKRATYSIQVSGATNNDFNAATCYSLRAESSATPFMKTNALPETNAGFGVSSSSTLNGYWRLYPIPVNNELNIYYNSAENARAELQIIDAVGRIIKGKNVDVKTGSNTFQLDMQPLKNGIYMIKLVLPNSVHTGKVIVESK